MINIERNKGVIIFYLLLILMTVVVINSNERKLGIESDHIYLAR